MMKGIILAGGSATRLRPLTLMTSKQLLPVYDRPMIFYPLRTLIEAGIKNILVIVAPDRAGDFLRVLGSGRKFGVRLTYEIQERPQGLAQAFHIGETFIARDPVTLILGDNIFFDDHNELRLAIRSFQSGARIFAKQVSDPTRFGVVDFDHGMRARSIVEKPKRPKSNYAVTGLYVYDNSVVSKSKTLKPSARQEYEITDVNNLYLREQALEVTMYSGEWHDAGTFDSLLAVNVAAAKRRATTLH